MKAYTHSITRSIKGNVAKLLSIIFIILIGIAFVSGVGTLSSCIKSSFNAYYQEANVTDLVIKNTSSSDFADEDEDGIYDIVEALESSSLVNGVTTVTAIDSSALELMKNTIAESIKESLKDTISETFPFLDSLVDYIDYIDLSNYVDVEILPEDFPLTRFSTIHEDQSINTLTVVEGHFPTSEDEIAIEQTEASSMIDYQIGDTIDLGDALGGVKEIVGIIQNPLITSKYGEPDLINQTKLEQIIYLYGDTITINFDITISLPLFGDYVIPITQDIPVSDIYVDLNLDNYSYLSSSYGNHVDECVEELNLTVLSDYSSDITILTLEENTSYAYLMTYCEKIDVIASIFPLFFIAVAALVVSSTMSRMVEEERNMIGCLTTLGYNDGQVIKKYVTLSLSCCLIACLLGMILGLFLIPTIIYPCLATTFYTPTISYLLSPLFGLLSSFGMILVVTLITIFTSKKMLKAKPATLLLPKAPKAGKKIWLENLRSLWKRLPFSIKSSFRNIFRYKKNLIMTVVSVAGSLALILAGFSLLDAGNALAEHPLLSGLKDTLVPIAVLIVCFAVVLCGVVIYNLTNMNIGERNREIATLKVLGYRELEVHMYIYREILIMAILGCVLGLPIGILLVYFVLTSIDIGTLSDVNIYTYFVSILIVFVLVGIVDLLLSPKIRKIDMSTSLKSLD